MCVAGTSVLRCIVLQGVAACHSVLQCVQMGRTLKVWFVCDKHAI